MRTRRRAWWRAAVWTTFALALAASAWGLLWEPARLVERDYTLALPQWPARCDGVRLDVVSDIHTGSPHNGIDNLDRIVQRLVASDSDAVLMAGDYLILKVFLGRYIAPERVAQHLRPLTARKRVYAVLGNHDWWKDGDRVRRAFESAGVVMIDNRALATRLRGCRVWLVGLGDLLEGHPDVGGAFAQVTDGAPAVALTHEPDLFPRIPPRAALTVAGHTHGGQIDPRPWGDVPGRFVAGSPMLKGHLLDGNRHLFVTPGIGTSIFPVRLGVPPEISRLTLVHGERTP